jgi:hypothetical protein
MSYDDPDNEWAADLIRHLIRRKDETNMADQKRKANPRRLKASQADELAAALGLTVPKRGRGRGDIGKATAARFAAFDSADEQAVGTMTVKVVPVTKLPRITDGERDKRSARELSAARTAASSWCERNKGWSFSIARKGTGSVVVLSRKAES